MDGLRGRCRAGDLAALRAYCAQHGVTAAQVREAGALQCACCCGHLAAARWLQQAFQLTAADARADANHALKWACANGHLAVARWLQQAFQLTAADARADDNAALRYTCAYGHLAVARWLQQAFQLAARDARAADNCALRGACAHGYLAVARWLQQAFQLAARDAWADNHYALRWACVRGHLSTVRWLQRTWGLPPAAQAQALASAPAGGACAGYLRSLRGLRWSPARHLDFPLPSRCAALAALLVRERQARAPGGLPFLPDELWLHLLSYLPAW